MTWTAVRPLGLRIQVAHGWMSKREEGRCAGDGARLLLVETCELRSTGIDLPF